MTVPARKLLRIYLQEHDSQLERISTDYRSRDELLLYSHAPVGGDRVWHGEIHVFRELNELGFYERLRRVPRPEDLPEGALLYTVDTATEPPRAAAGWLLAFRAEGIRLYVPAESSLRSLATDG